MSNHPNRSKTRYQVVMIDHNTWHPDCGHSVTSADCGHEHRTLRAADRCLSRLSKYWSDGTHNEWAHFGGVRRIAPDGHHIALTADEVDALDDLAYRQYTARR